MNDARVASPYRRTTEIDWHVYFTSQQSSGQSVKQYCFEKNINKSTWYSVYAQYKLCDDKPNFKHVKHTNEKKRKLTRSGESAVATTIKTQRTHKQFVTAHVVRKLMFTQIQQRHFTVTDDQINIVSMSSAYSLLKRATFIYRCIRLRSLNKSIVPDSTILNYQQLYNELAQLHTRDCILNCDGTTLNLAQLPKRGWVIADIRADDRTINIRFNTNNRVTLLNTVAADGTTLVPYFITPLVSARQFISNCQKSQTYSNTQQSHQRSYIHIDSGTNTDVICDYIQRVIIPYQQLKQATVILIMDAAGWNHSDKVKLLCSNNNIELIKLPANCTHYLQVNDLIVFGPLKSKITSFITQQIIHNVKPTIHAIVNRTIELLQIFNTNHIRNTFDFVQYAPLNQIKQRKGLYAYIHTQNQNDVNNIGLSVTTNLTTQESTN